MIRKSFIIGLLTFITMSSASAQWNNPHQLRKNNNVAHSAFSATPKTLDPAKAYSSDETQFIAQIYEPPLQYDYFKRPYTLIPLTATQMPKVTYYDSNHRQLPDNINPKKIAYTLYDIYIKPNIYYQPHSALAKDDQGHYRYLNLKASNLDDINSLSDFKYTGTRELVAEDYVYEIKRIAHPSLQSPIFGLMSNYIVGLDAFSKKMTLVPLRDLRKYNIKGVKALGPYHYQIKIKGDYPQFKYWLAMTFFAPIPWEADVFYSQPGMLDNNISLSWYPIGTGPYRLSENNPNKQMVLTKNPNFHGENYPLVADSKLSGKPMPFVDSFIFSLDKESIPRWNKFLQGYYDKSGISADSFDQAIKFDKNGNPLLTDELKKKGIKLYTSISPSIYYIGFNMLDDVVGGYSEKQRKLRQAIAIALDYEEYISIFMNGRGIPSQGPIPPEIFGYQKSNYNNFVYTTKDSELARRSLADAKKLLAEAGYPGGIDPKTGGPLILNYDASSTGSPDEQALLNWMRKQFEKIGIKLNVRATSYNRFQDKVRRGDAQIFSWGWMADYPDPENFLFLLYGPNGKVKYGGENASNYFNPKFDLLFQQIKNMPNNAARQAKINEALEILRQDSPWIWGVHPTDYVLSHAWNSPIIPNAMANNTLKYQKIDVSLRSQLREKWNTPVIWPILLLLSFVIIMFIPLTFTYWRRENRPNVMRDK